ncbi:hypothetical protein ABT189_42715 [Streptomyces sp900105755]|uniref:hypothetical protein n=1 Tax=Streptomyces sp. 900105755 TaxID=3154389 RepID=UPI00331FC3D7
MRELRGLTAFVQAHQHWDCRANGADMVAVRQALKHAPGAVPAPAGDPASIERQNVGPAA